MLFLENIRLGLEEELARLYLAKSVSSIIDVHNSETDLSPSAYFDPASEGREHREERLAREKTTNGTGVLNGKQNGDIIAAS